MKKSAPLAVFYPARKSVPNARFKSEVLPLSCVKSAAAAPTFQPDGPSRNTGPCSVGRCQQIAQPSQVIGKIQQHLPANTFQPAQHDAPERADLLHPADSRSAMKHRLLLSRHTTASARAFPAPRAAGCCSMPYRQNSPPLARVIVEPMTDIGVDLYVADGSMRQSSAISGTAAGVQSP